ncbi:NADPH:quinone oxidoreductase family protein [Nesterenkonia alkaliphila]|uniref:Zinc-binding dehydrogenase n=1 Tax=Nesterenkonia alkaliphila TaxID=1463631 RepID=A0A7K1UI33_9MICC|nr:NADPH:quinone oxidoreductase family protein [Nesterenkonia alkaliphila]MVT26128.1 zinc-binding dehydrogenase [Nesterenkonia alkaliphila]GFZ98105.1 NADPH:quinone oxidoreductase [Nesterenkonia alkaliphila]
MRAIQITSLNGPEAVELNDIPGLPEGKQVIIETKAAGVAFPELLQTRGLYQVKPELPFTPGAEVAGVVKYAPQGSDLNPGDRVAALCLLGGFAEEVAADPNLTFKLPDNVSFEQGAAFLFNYCTVHFALLDRGNLREGERVLVHGAAGGIGTAAIQVAKAFGAGEVIGVASTEEKAKVATNAGADRVISPEGFLETIGRGSVDIVLDPVGGDRFTDSLRALDAQGRLLVIGFTAGEIPEVKVNRLLLNNISVVGVGWGAYARTRPHYIPGQWEQLQPHLASGALAPPLGPTYPLEKASEAIQVLEQRSATGKVLLTV